MIQARSLVEKLKQFQGEELIDVIDHITRMAEAHDYVVNVVDPEFNRDAIDVDYSRLNVRIDANSKILAFTIG